MNDHEWELEVRGDYRAVIGYDMYAEHPDGDVQGTVVYVDDRGYHNDTTLVGEGGVDHGDVVTALEHYAYDWDLTERYLRMWCSVVGFDYFDVDHGRYVFIVTEADLKHWGFKDLAEYQQVAGHEDPTSGTRTEWRAWVEGDVYYVDIQERCTKQVEVFNSDGLCKEAYRETSWESVDTCHGFYGSDYAEGHALDTLNHYAPQD